ncbi:Uncharacterised protein [Mycobacteroides abscessus subsp. abscessus]|nr:Uncharacterised protein [Mycobacteroides abscessus subsp. abscessus]
MILQGRIVVMMRGKRENDPKIKYIIQSKADMIQNLNILSKVGWI